MDRSMRTGSDGNATGNLTGTLDPSLTEMYVLVHATSVK